MLSQYDKDHQILYIQKELSSLHQTTTHGVFCQQQNARMCNKYIGYLSHTICMQDQKYFETMIINNLYNYYDPLNLLSSPTTHYMINYTTAKYNNYNYIIIYINSSYHENQLFLISKRLRKDLEYMLL